MSFCGLLLLPTHCHSVAHCHSVEYPSYLLQQLVTLWAIVNLWLLPVTLWKTALLLVILWDVAVLPTHCHSVVHCHSVRESTLPTTAACHSVGYCHSVATVMAKIVSRFQDLHHRVPEFHN